MKIKNYKELNKKITNEPIEEVEEAKEASELNHSSEYYNSISEYDSKRNIIGTFSIEDSIKKNGFKKIKNQKK